MAPTDIAIVVFGVTGDLTRRKLIPGLYQLVKSKSLLNSLTIYGFARRPWTDLEMQNNLKQGIHDYSRSKPVNKDNVELLLMSSKYIASTFDDDTGYVSLKNELSKCHFEGIIFYLATPPNEYMTIIQKIGSNGLHQLPGWHRIVVEKPFGFDLDSAQELELTLQRDFKESEIFRIDHYLGKETVQNILVLRFANGIFEPLWNNHYIDHVQITVAETIGVGTRAGYFDQIGLVRDMFANHLLQLLTLTAMEVPSTFNADSVRNEKIKVLRSLRQSNDQDLLMTTVRGQYTSGKISDQSVCGYKEESGVIANSTTETYMAIRLFLDNWRWAGVPFYIRCGKRMPKQATEIAIHFKQVPLALFDWKNFAGIAPNTLVFRIQPDEGISLTLGAKKPGYQNQISPVVMEFCYHDTFGIETPEAYERLLLDCINGDATLFTRTDEVIEQWKFTQKILDGWKKLPRQMVNEYQAGTWGPSEADRFIESDGKKWLNPA
jgi:glucose-6-phosphate 1-dehydrogenase